MAERERAYQVVDEWQYQLKADGKPWIILEFHQRWQLVEMVTQAITEAVAEERNRTHNTLTNLRNSGPTFRLNDLKEWEHGWDCGVADAVAAIRKEVKP